MRGLGIGKVDSCPKVNSPPDYEWARAITGGGRGLHVEKAQSALRVILKLVMGGLISHLDYLKYSLSSVPGSGCSHFFEASSWSCGSLCHGYSLVVI